MSEIAKARVEDGALPRSQRQEMCARGLHRLWGQTSSSTPTEDTGAVSASQIAIAEWRAKNHEARVEYDRRYEAEHAEAIKERKRQYGAKHREAKRAYNRKYHARNREAILQQKREYYARSREARLESQRQDRARKRVERQNGGKPTGRAG